MFHIVNLASVLSIPKEKTTSRLMFFIFRWFSASIQLFFPVGADYLFQLIDGI